MSWQRLRVSRRCWFCPTIIEPGDLVRLGVHTPATWCVACALAKLDETPPATVLDPAPPPGPVAPVAAVAVPETLFDLEPDDTKFKHADARLALEQLRNRFTEPAASPNAEGGDES